MTDTSATATPAPEVPVATEPVVEGDQVNDNTPGVDDAEEVVS